MTGRGAARSATVPRRLLAECPRCGSHDALRYGLLQCPGCDTVCVRASVTEVDGDA